MAATLKALIIASGNAGSAGQSFLNHVTGAASGAKASDYKLTAASFSGEPNVGAGDYSSNELFSIVATFTRNSRAHHIQRNVSAAWGVIIDAATASVSLESFAAGGSPTGATHTLGVRVLGKRTGSPTGSASTAQPGSEPGPGVPWAVQWTASLASLGGSGTSPLTITWSYNPDTGAFNPNLGDEWTGSFANRPLDAALDFEFEWRTAATGGGTLISTAQQFTLTTDFNGVYPTDANGLLGGESATLYLRWRVKVASGGSGTWSDIGPVSRADPRPAS